MILVTAGDRERKKASPSLKEGVVRALITLIEASPR